MLHLTNRRKPDDQESRIDLSFKVTRVNKIVLIALICHSNARLSMGFGFIYESEFPFQRWADSDQTHTQALA